MLMSNMPRIHRILLIADSIAMLALTQMVEQGNTFQTPGMVSSPIDIVPDLPIAMPGVEAPWALAYLKLKGLPFDDCLKFLRRWYYETPNGGAHGNFMWICNGRPENMEALHNLATGADFAVGELYNNQGHGKDVAITADVPTFCNLLEALNCDWADVFLPRCPDWGHVRYGVWEQHTPMPDGDWWVSAEYKPEHQMLRVFDQDGNCIREEKHADLKTAMDALEAVSA